MRFVVSGFWFPVSGFEPGFRVTRSRWRAVPASLVMLAGCGQSALQPQTLPPPSPEPYVLQVGDLIAVKFYRNPELNEEVTVRPDGKISLQLMDDVPAAGLSPAALGEELARRYEPELKEAHVNVIVKTFASHRIFVAGEVGRQGTVELGSGLTLYRAIQQAGGFLKSANRKQVVLIRRDPGGKEIGHAIDLRAVESGEEPAADVVLQAQDVVFVPRSRIANVNLFVEQYVRNNLPVQNVGLGFPF
jgi:polysaccharide export outer membrane protein